MSGIGLSKALNGDTLRRFASLAKQSQSASSSLRGPLGQDQAITSGLRIGARTFSSALDGLNSAVSFVNLSEKALATLSDLTDKLIDVTRRATDVAASKGTRQELQIEFKRLAGEFRRTVKNATTGDNEFLSKEGLSEIFTTIGLDQKSSDSIAAVFSQFVTPVADDSLASEQNAASYVSVPVGAFSARRSDAEVLVSKISNNSGTVSLSGGISQVNSLVNDRDVALNQNPTKAVILATALNGNTTAASAGTLSAGLELLAVNETTGYSVVTSTSDPLGYNAGGYNQIFIVNASGDVVQQVTSNASVATTYSSADISADDLTVAYIENTGTTASVLRAKFSSLGVDPTTATSLTVMSVGLGSSPFIGVKIDNSGEYIAFQDASVDPIITYFYSASSGTFDALIQGTTGITSYGFVQAGKLAYIDGTGIYRQTFDDGAPRGLVYGTSYTSLSTLEGGTDGYFGYYDTDTDMYQVLDVNDLEVQLSVQLSSSDSIFSTSLAFNSDGSHIDLGIVGVMSSFGGDSDRELYRIRYNPAAVEGIRSSASTPSQFDAITGGQITSIFDDSRDISKRGQAFRTLEDLKALKSQISKNLQALDGARNVLQDNIKLVRATGLAFLEMAEQVRTSVDAETLAESLRQRIRASAPTALSQAENLNPITVAALTYGV
ncbi:MAG: hypothetical protein J0M12_11110 [Deltaproteobacteria bacterium]|nr:hypothetical protein [Deltaproteobacteria bacterium]